MPQTTTSRRTENRPRTVADGIVAFCRFVRSEGFKVGTRETLDAVQTARLDVLPDRPLFKRALRALLCSSQDEWRRFNGLFEQFWLRASSTSHRQKDVHRMGRSTRVQQQNPLLGIGTTAEGTPDETGTGSAAASTLERLQRTDFSQVAPEDEVLLVQLVLRLARRMRLRLARKQRPRPGKGRIDLRRTIRRSIAYGGDPVDLRYKRPKPRKPRLVALLDVSRSMDAYSFFLLRFIFALQRHFERVDAFLFSTRLTCVTEALRARRFTEMLPWIAVTAEAWSSGTRIGACLQTFNQDYARKVLTKDTIVFVLSDGLDTGDTASLTTELKCIKQRAGKLIWLNPLLGMEAYQPTARGMAAAWPLVDAFVAAHNLESLLDLEVHLKHV